MSRLSSVPSRLGSVPSRLSRGPVPDADRNRQRDAMMPWRGWYKTARWQALRLQVLTRDGWTCRATGVALIEGKHAAHCAVVDHKVPHRGDPVLFWDPDNLQSVAKGWHDSAKQKQERAGRW